MTEEEIRELFYKVVSNRNWYSGTSINCAQAFEIKKRAKRKELSLGRILEILIELDMITIASSCHQ